MILDIFPATNSGVRSGGTGFATQRATKHAQSYTERFIMLCGSLCSLRAPLWNNQVVTQELFVIMSVIRG